MLAENETIGWRPEHVKHGRFGRWLEGNVDWALSRERYWGTPLPIWECEGADCEERFCAGSVAELRDRAGEVPEDLHRPYIDEVTFACEACGGTMRRVEEVIDAWYDSGAMPFAQFHYPFEGEEEFEQRFPADYISEAQDQTRGWFYSLLAESVLLFDQTSYRNCVCLGLILDAEGQKMSTSRGNVVDPWQVIDRHGSDAFRWYLLTAQQPWAVYRFSTETVGESVRQFLLTLWNTYSSSSSTRTRRALGPEEISGEPVTDLDRWAVSRLQGVTRTVIDRMDDFDCTDGRARDRRATSTSSRTGTCGSTGGASGTATGPRSPRCATAWSRLRSCSPRSSRSSPTRSTATSPATATRSTSRTTPSPTRSSRTASSRPGSRPRCGRSSSAAPRARRPRSRTASPWRGR